MIIKRFGEKKEDKWYELENGERVACDEATISKLWCSWVASGNSQRADTNEFIVFEFIKPVEIDFATLQDWTL